MELSACLHQFFHTYLHDQRAVSSHTLKSYRDTFKLFVAYLHAKKRAQRLNVEILDVKTVLAFLQHLEQERDNGIQTRNQRLAAIQCFFHYVSLHHPSLEPQAKRILAVPVKRVPPTPVSSLNKKELETLLAQPVSSTPDGFRDLCILTFLYNTGARAQEVADAKLSWFDFPNRTATITGKGRRTRITPLWPSTVQLLKSYKDNDRRKPKPETPDYFFINQRGGPFTRFGIRAIVKKYLKSAAKHCPSIAEKKLSTHSLRHTTACHLLESKVDPNVIKAWLGHASISSTSRYLDTDLNHKRRILDQFGPPNYVVSSLGPKKGDSPDKILDWLDDL